jgi:hypothetical protein
MIISVTKKIAADDSLMSVSFFKMKNNTDFFLPFPAETIDIVRRQSGPQEAGFLN